MPASSGSRSHGIDRRDRSAPRPNLLPLRAEVRRDAENRRCVRPQERPLAIPTIEANYRIQPKQESRYGSPNIFGPCTFDGRAGCNFQTADRFHSAEATSFPSRNPPAITGGISCSTGSDLASDKIHRSSFLSSSKSRLIFLALEWRGRREESNHCGATVPSIDTSHLG